MLLPLSRKLIYAVVRIYACKAHYDDDVCVYAHISMCNCGWDSINTEVIRFDMASCTIASCSSIQADLSIS